VNFGTASVQHLPAEAHFSIEVDCNGSRETVSGKGKNHSFIGFQVSPGAFAAAKALKLTNAWGGVLYLLSDQYLTSSGMAKGVGITLHDANKGRRWFVGQGTISNPPILEGWYPVLDGAIQAGDPAPGITRHRLDFTARLEKLPKETVTPGKVRATAHVLVRVQ